MVDKLKRKTFDHPAGFMRGSALLRKLNWHAEPDAMFKAPSLAKGQAARNEIETEALKLGIEAKDLTADVLLAARIEHFIGICGPSAKAYFLGDQCFVDRKAIAKLSRRMPPFIHAKVIQLQNGVRSVESNPTGAFDTDGWGELRTRIPKFRATMERYASLSSKTSPRTVLSEDEMTRLADKLHQIINECAALKLKASNTLQEQPGHPSVSAGTQPEWASAIAKIAQVLGVLIKTNRDMSSSHWKRYIATPADRLALHSNAGRITAAANTILGSLKTR